jgi:hypothetical protein
MNGQVENVLMCRGRVDGNLPGGLPGSKGAREASLRGTEPHERQEASACVQSRWLRQDRAGDKVSRNGECPISAQNAKSDEISGTAPQLGKHVAHAVQALSRLKNLDPAAREIGDQQSKRL